MKITLADRNGVDTFTMTAYQTAIPQLAVHRRLNGRGDPIPKSWDVTHKPTGMKLTYRALESRALAKAFASKLTGLNWEFTDSSVPKGERAKLYGRVINSARIAAEDALDESRKQELGAQRVLGEATV